MYCMKIYTMRLFTGLQSVVRSTKTLWVCTTAKTENNNKFIINIWHILHFTLC